MLLPSFILAQLQPLSGGLSPTSLPLGTSSPPSLSISRCISSTISRRILVSTLLRCETTPQRTNSLSLPGWFIPHRKVYFDAGRSRGAGKLEHIRVFSNDTRVLRDYSATLLGREDHRRTSPVYDTLPRGGRIDEGIEVTEGVIPHLKFDPFFSPVIQQ